MSGSSSNNKDGPTVWKHIGLHGHSVGTFACEADRIVWKSAISGRDDDHGTATSRSLSKPVLAAALWTVFGRSGHLRVQTKKDSGIKHELRFDGFPVSDFDMLKTVLRKKYNLDLQIYNLSAAGTQYGLTNIKGKNLFFKHCVLEEATEDGQEFEPRREDEMMSLDLAEVSQCVLPGNNRNEIEVQFPESDAVEAGTDQLVSIRFYIPPDLEADKEDKEADTAAELLQQSIMQTANIRKTTGDIIVSFPQSKGTFLTPRGRYGVELYDYFLRMRGQKYDYKIKYDDISRLFLLPKPDEVHMAFVIALDKPIRQGQQRYQYLVMQCSKDPDEVTVNLDEESLKNDYGGDLQPVMRGSLSNLVAKIFKVIAKKKVFIPGKFANANQQACVKCAVRANEGLLYPLEKQFVFIHKPPILVRFNEVESVEFQRYAGGQGSTRNFDLCVNLKTSVTGGSVKDYTFSGIDRSDYAGLYNFLSSKKIPIKNLQEASLFEEVRPSAPVYNEDEIYGGPDLDGEEGSEDESYGDDAAAADEQAIEEDSEADMDDDDMGSEVDDGLDSDLEEARNKGKRSKKASAAVDDDGDDDDEEGESPKKKQKRKPKAKKDPNAPKRATSAYFYFTSENRERVKEENPDATFGDMGKLLGAEWKTMDDDAKDKFNKLATADKERYQNEMKDYSPPASTSKKGAKAKPKKDPNAPKRNLTSFFIFSNNMRSKIKEENPGLSFGELGKKVGGLFKDLSPEEKTKYEDLAKEDKIRYKEAMAAYKEKQAQDSDDDDDEEETPVKAKGKAKPKAKQGKPKKAESDDNDSDDDDEELDDDSDDSD